LRRYVVAILDATRADPRVDLGASPRAGLMLFRAAKAMAALDGRDHALPDDVQALAEVVLAHRIVLAPEAIDATGERIVADALAATPAL
jgi:MoxR-like ATPase